MPDKLPLSDIAHIIQLSVAPVFLLVAIGSFLNVITHRLGRIIDRARVIERELGEAIDREGRIRRIEELKSLDRRMVFSNAAINFCAASALLVAFDVALLFLGALAPVDATFAAGVIFILAMAGIIGGLCAFLVEISIATRTLRVKAELLTNR